MKFWAKFSWLVATAAFSCSDAFAPMPGGGPVRPTVAVKEFKPRTNSLAHRYTYNPKNDFYTHSSRQAALFSKRTSSSKTTALQQSDNSQNAAATTTTTTTTSLLPNDPVELLLTEIRAMDVNALVNTGILVLVGVAVLAKLTLVDSDITRGWTAAEVAVRIPLDTWESYSSTLQRAPLQTKAITSATVYTIGDIIAQSTEGTSIGQLDRPRILRSLLAGLLGHGPLSHIWYDVSEGFFNDVLHWTAWWSFVPKIVLDQTTWAPFWNNLYIIMLGAMKLEDPKNIWADIKRTTIPLIVSGLKLWPLAHCITYGLIPVENRLLWVDMVEIVWVTILATQAAGGAAASHVGEDKEAAAAAGKEQTTMS